MRSWAIIKFLEKIYTPRERDSSPEKFAIACYESAMFFFNTVIVIKTCQIRPSTGSMTSHFVKH